MIFILCSVSYAQRYKHYLNVSQIEEELSNIVIRPRLETSEWLDFLGPRKNQKYQVQVGENFWRISQKMFGDPFLWRKLWQVNDMIQNPHIIEPGTLLAYYREDQNIPMVKLRPANRGVASDLENDIVVNQKYTTHLRVTHIVAQEAEILGEVSGSYTSRKQMSYLEEPYLVFREKNRAKVGDIFGVGRVEKISNKRYDVQFGAGKFLRILGDVKVIEVGENLVKAEILGSFGPILRGDFIIPVQRMIKRPGVFSAPDELTSVIVAGEEPDRTIFGQGDLVILNKGTGAGMQEGFYFRVFRDTDPELKSRETVEPHFKGEISVVYAAESMSIGYVVRNNEPLEIGDAIVPYRTFNDPPKRIHKEVEQIAVD
jgi:hypothetical protein